MLEREMKFEVPEHFLLPDLSRIATVVAPAGPCHLHAAYFDTDDLDLLACGITLRRRVEPGRAGWTLKLPAGEAGGALCRHEVEAQGTISEVPASLSLAVAAAARGRPLTLRAEVATERTEYLLRDPSGRCIAALDDDLVAARTVDGRDLRLRELELELREAATQGLAEAIAQALGAAGATRSAPRPKLARILGRDPSPAAEPAALPRGASARSVLGTAIARAVREVVTCDPVIRLDLDAEAVHDARVAMRRVRAQLGVFGGHFDPAWRTVLRGELAWHGEGLGRLRDADVQLRRLDAWAGRLRGSSGAGVDRLREILASERAAAREDLLEQMGTPRYLALLDALRAAAADPPLREGAASGPAGLARDVLRAWHRLGRAVAELPRRPSPPDLHTVRIGVKRVRYAAEALVPLARRDGGAWLRALRDVQQSLGDVQDAVMAARWLRAAAAAHPEVAQAAASLQAAGRSEARRALRDWEGAWRRASAKGGRRWLKDLGGR